MLAPIQRETFLGNAEVLQAFDISKVGRSPAAGSPRAWSARAPRVRIVREDVVVLELGTLQTLKRFKDEVNEVAVRPGMRHGLRRASRTSRPATSSSASPSKRSSGRSRSHAPFLSPREGTTGRVRRSTLFRISVVRSGQTGEAMSFMLSSRGPARRNVVARHPGRRLHGRDLRLLRGHADLRRHGERRGQAVARGWYGDGGQGQAGRSSTWSAWPRTT